MSEIRFILVVLLIVGRLKLLVKASGDDYSQLELDANLLKLNLEGMKGDINVLLEQVNNINFESNKNYDEDDHKKKLTNMKDTSELQNEFLKLQNQIHKLNTEVEQNTVDIDVIKNRTKILEQEIAQFQANYIEVLEKSNSELGYFSELFTKLTEMYKKVTLDLTDEIEDLESLDSLRSCDVHNIIIEAIFYGSYELAAVKLSLIEDDNDVNFIIEDMVDYSRYQAVYFVSTIHNMTRRALAFKMIYNTLAKRNDLNNCMVIFLIELVKSKIIKVLPYTSAVYHDMSLFIRKLMDHLLFKVEEIYWSIYGETLFISSTGYYRFIAVDIRDIQISELFITPFVDPENPDQMSCKVKGFALTEWDKLESLAIDNM